MIKTMSRVLIISICLYTSVFAQKVLEKDFYQTVSYLPLSLAGFSYEAMFKKKHAVMAEGTFSYLMKNINYSAGLYYKNHFAEKKMKRKKSRKYVGMKLQYFGPTAKFISIENTYYDESLKKYNYSAQYLLLGIHYGKKRIFRPGITLHSRIGLGYPIKITKFTWETKPITYYSLMEKLTRGLSALDYGISIGYSF